jgi:hypothetical protein
MRQRALPCTAGERQASLVQDGWESWFPANRRRQTMQIFGVR